MRWSWKIGKITGIGIYMHATFLLLIAWLGWTEWQQTHNPRAVLSVVLFLFALFACIVAHEFGHALTARRYGIQTREITLLPIGGVSSLERIPEEPRQELLVAVAGPLVSLAIAAGLLLILWITGAGRGVNPAGPWGNVPFTEQLMLANLVLAVFNLLPAFPMDGGRILRAALSRRMDRVRATRIAARIGQVLAVGFALLALIGNPLLFLIALFVWLGAGQEAAFVEIKSSLSGIPVSRITVTDLHIISPDDPLRVPVELMLHGTQQDFPVIDNGRLVGLLTRKELLSGVSQKGPDTPVAEAMRRDYAAVSGTEMLEDVSPRLLDPESRALLVTENGRLLGLLTVENMAEFVMLQSAMRQSSHVPAGNKPAGKHAA